MNKQICVECGVEFHIPFEMDKKLRANHKIFYCPNGHGQSYRKGQTKEEQEIHRLNNIIRQLSSNCDMYKNSAREYRESCEELRRSRGYYKGQITRLKKQLEV